MKTMPKFRDVEDDDHRQCSVEPRDDAAANGAWDAPPRPEEPPAVLAHHRDLHRKVGMQLRDEAMRLLERSQQHLSLAAGFEEARRQISH